MSYLFKTPNLVSSMLSDSELRKMATLWDGNCDIPVEAVKEKWKETIGSENVNIFLQKLRQTIMTSPGHIKRIYRIDPDMYEQFEKNMWDTIETLEDAFMYN